jgi:hypothetical protein
MHTDSQLGCTACNPANVSHQRLTVGVRFAVYATDGDHTHLMHGGFVCRDCIVRLYRTLPPAY